MKSAILAITVFLGMHLLLLTESSLSARQSNDRIDDCCGLTTDYVGRWYWIVCIESDVFGM